MTEPVSNHGITYVFANNRKKIDQLTRENYWPIYRDPSAQMHISVNCAYNHAFGLCRRDKRFVIHGTRSNEHISFVIGCLAGVIPNRVALSDLLAYAKEHVFEGRHSEDELGVDYWYKISCKTLKAAKQRAREETLLYRSGQWIRTRMGKKPEKD